MGANGTSRLRTQRDLVRIFAQVTWLSVRLSPTMTDTRNQPGIP